MKVENHLVAVWEILIYFFLAKKNCLGVDQCEFPTCYKEDQQVT